MIREVDTENEVNRIGYFAVIPATVLFNNSLKPNEKLLYALITALSNKEGYCYASNKYLGEKLGVDPKTITSWLADLRKFNYIMVDLIRNENKEIIQRKIYPHDVPYPLNNVYPSPSKNVEATHQISEDNNINNKNINTHTVTKKKYSENIYLYDFEYKELINIYGENKTHKCIEELSLYKKSKGVEYKSDFATIKRWVIARVEELEQRQEKQNNKKRKSKCNFEQREYPPEFFESLYENIPSPTSNESEESKMDLDM